MNPLLDFSGLPRFAEIQPEHVTPAVDQLLAENRALLEQLANAAEAPTWDSLRRAARRRQRAAVARLGAGRASERGDEQPGSCARSTTPTCPRSPSTTPSCRRTSACTRSSRRSAPRPALRSSAPSSRKIVDNELRDFRLGGAELPPEQKARFKAMRERLDQLSVALQRQRAGCHQCLLPSGDRSGRARRHSRGRAGSARSGGRSGRQAGLEAHPAHAVLPAGDAVRRQPRAARADVPRLRHARRGVRQRRLGQHAADRRDPEAARAGGAHARLRELRRAVARRPRWRTRRSRSSRFSTTWPRASSPLRSATIDELARFARERLGLERLEAWDIGWASEKLREERYAFSEQEVKQYFPEDRGAAAACSGWWKRCTASASRPAQAADVASGRALLRHPYRRRRADRPVLSRPVRAPVQARRRMDGRRHHPQARAAAQCRRRSPTSPATSPRRSAARRRCSRTTK